MKKEKSWRRKVHLIHNKKIKKKENEFIYINITYKIKQKLYIYAM